MVQELIDQFVEQNPTLGGGSAFLELLLTLAGTTAQQRSDRGNVGLGLVGQRANTGSDILSQLLGAEQAANRSPIGLVDRLALGEKFGSFQPLTQLGSQRLTALGSRPKSSLAQRLAERLTEFATAQTGTEGAVDEFAQGAVPMATGGRLIIDPTAKKSQKLGGSTVKAAGPVTINDRTGQTLALAGEAGGTEVATVRPVPTPPPPNRTLPVPPLSDPNLVPRQTLPQVPTGSGVPGATFDLPEVGGADTVLTAQEKIRFDEITRLAPHMPERLRLLFAQRPGDFDFSGVPEANQGFSGSGARGTASRLLGASIGEDRRISPALLMALALGRTPTPGSLNARDLNIIGKSPDRLGGLQSVIGEELLPAFLAELQSQTPTGGRVRTAQRLAI